MNLEKLKDTARKHEQREDWRKAIDAYQRVIQHYDSGREADADLTIYNRVGDLHLKLNDPGSAVQSFERAAELYAEQGFLNNAIALCGKMLRVNPGRVQVYLQLAHLHARKNVVSEAKRNLIEYMERMNTLGRLDEAFGQLKAFADQHSANQDIRMMLVELLRAASRTEEAQEQLEHIASELEARGDRAGARKTRERIQTIDSTDDVEPAGGNDLIFLETGFEPPHLSSRRHSAPSAAAADAALPPEPEPAPPPVEGLDTFEPPAIAAAEVESERLADLQSSSFQAEDASGAVSPVDGLELDAPQLDEGMLEADANGADRGEGFPSLDFTVEQSSDAPVELTSGTPDLELESALSDDDTSLDAALAPADLVDMAVPEVESAGAFVDDFDIGEPIELQSRRDDAEGFVEQEEPMLPSEEAAEATPMASAWDAPLAEAPPVADAEPREVSDLSIEELEDRILDDPDSGALHRALGDRLARDGDLGRAVEEFVLSITAFERDEAWLPALDAVDALLALEPDAIRHQQNRVELAYRSGDRSRLLGAYMGLAEALVRAEALDKAVAVYRRVLEHDPGNTSARDALAWLEKETTPATKAAAPAPEESAPPARAVAPAVPPGPAAPVSQPGPRPAFSDSADYVDLGSMVIDAGGPRDTRMRVDGERPTGDEQKDFQETLEQFKRGIEANLGTEDYEAHYDLGIAFKEMGLLDEAIAEFQKALRAPNGRLRTSEALGITFFEKQQFAIAETILRRAVETLEGGDDEKIGLLYWLGRACESQGKSGDARQAFERALAVDIRFMDLNDRIRQLATGRQS
jgi:tetratricopeptide (TPR) repeat protein